MFSISKLAAACLGLAWFAALSAYASETPPVPPANAVPVSIAAASPATPAPAAAPSPDASTEAQLPPEVLALLATAEKPAQSAEEKASAISHALDTSLALIGIRYKRGGISPLTGFDCSGFVGHIFHESLGLTLPRSAKEISKTGETVKKEELKPGDLVFFNTMRRAFSHVGIYLGGNLFVHSPRTGGKVRVDDLSNKYWSKTYNGARRFVD